METEKSVAPRNGLSAREKGFLSSLARKYETSDDAGQVRSYIIAAAGTLALFAIARWLPWWWAALIAFEAAALPGVLASFLVPLLVAMPRESRFAPISSN